MGTIIFLWFLGLSRERLKTRDECHVIRNLFQFGSYDVHTFQSYLDALTKLLLQPLECLPLPPLSLLPPLTPGLLTRRSNLPLLLRPCLPLSMRLKFWMFKFSRTMPPRRARGLTGPRTSTMMKKCSSKNFNCWSIRHDGLRVREI